MDFWHAAEYLGKAAVLYWGQPAAHETWLEENCHSPKYDPGGTQTVLKQ